MNTKQQALDSLFNAFIKTPELNEVISELEHVLHTKDPFAIYTSTKKEGEWIFNKKDIFSMLGGEDKYNKLYEATCTSDEVLFIILKKIGPIFAVPIDLDSINDLLDRLYKSF